MRTPIRRRGALTAVLGLVLGTASVVATGAAVHAGSATVTNACQSNATLTWSDLDWTLNGTGVPNPIELGTGTVTVTGGSIQGAVPADLLVAGFNLGLLVEGENEIPSTLFIAREASNVVGGPVIQVDELNFTATTIIDNTGATPTATPIEINEPLPDIGPLTPSGGNIEVRQAPPGSLPTIPAGVAANGAVTPLGSLYTISSVAGGLVRANFDCQPGASLDSTGDGDNNTFTAAESWQAYETIEVTAPPTAPVCENESLSVGVGQSITINLNDNCTDINEDQGGGSPFTFAIDDSGLNGTLTATATNGVYSYEAPANDPGAPDTFTFTATDTTELESNEATVSINILANQCDATAESCSLTQIVVQEVEGGALTFDKEPGVVVMSTVTLDGDAQVSTGALNQVTVTNARGSAAGWSLTAYSTDIGADGGPTVDLTAAGLPGVVIPVCTVEGTPFGGAIGENTDADRLCIPGNNLAWSPSAAIVHDVIYGDVAVVEAGSALATDAADWRSQLVAAGNANAGGLGGIGAANSLCSAPTNQSGGTFGCGAAMYLGVPASAGAGTYSGALVMTLT